MNERTTIYSNQMARLDRLSKAYEYLAVRGTKGMKEAMKAFENYCRVQQIKFSVTVQLLNVDK